MSSQIWETEKLRAWKAEKRNVGAADLAARRAATGRSVLAIEAIVMLLSFE